MLKVQSVVLVVDDKSPDLGLMAGALKRGGFSVITASDGADAVRAHARHSDQIDLLITDVTMAPITGYELTDLLTTAQKDLRVLYISGSLDAEMLRHLLRDRNASFLRKPFTSDELLAKVSETLPAQGERVQAVGG
jgi:DNA-binding NtrC family response regulator